MTFLGLRKYAGADNALGIRERKPGLDNYNIGFNANKYNFEKNNKIANKIEKDAPASIKRRNCISKRGESFDVFDIVCKGEVVGQLSKSSTIAQTMRREDIGLLEDFFVSDIFYWTYEDTRSADERNAQDGHPTTYALQWCPEAIRKGFIFIVSISGYGRQQN